VIDTPESGEVVARSIDYGAAAAKNPRLIITSITPYGCGGPYAARRATDLVSLAAGGLLSLGGYADTEPIAIAGGQAHLAAAIFSVVGILAALVAREESGRGRWIDVSTQECVAFALEDAVPEWYINRRLRRRNGARAREAGTGIYPCQDGFVSIVAGRLGTAKAFVALAEWIAASDIPGAEALRDPRWSDFRFRQSDEGIAQFADLFAKFCAMRSKQELYREGQNRQIAIAPVNTIADVMCDAQLASNGYFQSCFQAALGKNVTFPGAPYRLARTRPRPAASVPSPGQHNSELLESAQSRPFAALD
jgi:benzylsuccinate CoA-transferase BbsE subunit